MGMLGVDQMSTNLSLHLILWQMAWLGHCRLDVHWICSQIRLGKCNLHHRYQVPLAQECMAMTSIPCSGSYGGHLREILPLVLSDLRGDGIISLNLASLLGVLN